MTKRGVIVMVVAVAVLAAAGGAAVWRFDHHTQHSAAAAAVPIATAAVLRTDLSSTTQLSGTLGYAGAYAIPPQNAGIVTALPQPGQVITRGQVAYEADGSPVFLFYGARPSWRTLAIGVSPDADVRELEENLTVLGYANGSNLTVDDTFTYATTDAIRRWQLATGQSVTGQVTLGTLTYQPGPIRVLTVHASLGSAAPPGESVYDASSTTPTVTVPVPAAQTYLVHAGDAVTVTLPAGTTVPGRIDAISSVAVSADSGSGGSGSQSANAASVPARISLTNPNAVGGLDQAPVTVNVTDHHVSGVLAVPITALIALSGGGYGVYVDHGAGQRELVSVTPGLFATTLVQVATPGLHAGDRVEVPTQ